MILVFAMLPSLSPAVAADATTVCLICEENASNHQMEAVIYTTDISAESTKLYIHDAEKNKRIDDLFALRCELEVNYPENEDMILQIDRQLAELGVEYITQNELYYALGYDVLPAADIVNTDTYAQWTSRRLVSTYRGQHYELQIIEGIPLDENSYLRRTDASPDYRDSQIIAGITEIIVTGGVVALGSTPDPGWNLAVTLLDTTLSIGGVVIDMLHPDTIIEGITGNSTVSLATHMKVVLVKPYGTSDSQQKWLYTGNYITYTVTSTLPVNSEVDEHGSHADHMTSYFQHTLQSAYFDDYSIALQNYTSEQAGVEYTIDHSLIYLELKIFNKNKRFEIPRHIAGIYIN